MSWLFGKKKHRESPPNEPEQSTLTASQSDDYIIIEKEINNPFSPTFVTSGGLYPDLGDQKRGSVTYPSGSMDHFNQSSDNQNYLSGIPFKLSKIFDNDFEIERLRIDEITSFVDRIKNEDYDYSFTVERSVISEMDSGMQ